MSKLREFEGSLWSGDKILRPIYERHYRVMKAPHESLKLRATIRAGQYAWPGGYQLYLLMVDGDSLCFECARKEYWYIARAIRDNDTFGWRVLGCDTNYEDTDMVCCHCNKKIPAAYGDDDDNEHQH